jgi:hypothetical protein
MTERLENPPSASASEPAAALAAFLAGALVTRLESSRADVDALAQAMSLLPARGDDAVLHRRRH